MTTVTTHHSPVNETAQRRGNGGGGEGEARERDAKRERELANTTN